MKIRTDFVTNSSSTSFILGEPFDKTWSKKDIFEWFKKITLEMCDIFKSIEKEIRNIDAAFYNELVEALKLDKYIWIDKRNCMETIKDRDAIQDKIFNIYYKLDKDPIRMIFNIYANRLKYIRCSGYDLKETYTSIIDLNIIYNISKANTIEDIEDILELKIIDLECEAYRMPDDEYTHEILGHYAINMQNISTLGKILIYHGDDGCLPYIIENEIIRLGAIGGVHL